MMISAFASDQYSAVVSMSLAGWVTGFLVAGIIFVLLVGMAPPNLKRIGFAVVFRDLCIILGILAITTPVMVVVILAVFGVAESIPMLVTTINGVIVFCVALSSYFRNVT